jgi:hypothetical protein
LLALRSLPHTPGHDGVRQFLPAFGLLALLAGLGTASVIERLGRAGRMLSSTALVEGAIGLVVMWPVPLSYYSPVVGGLPGATALGMEPTYYWDALGDETLDWLKAHTGPGQKVRFATYPTSWLYLRDQGRLPPGLLPGDAGVWAWYVVQNRPGAFSPLDRALVERGRPAWVVRKLGVPLLWIFPFDQVEALMRPGPVGPRTTAHERNPRTKRPTAPLTRGGRTVGPDSEAVVNGPTGSLARGLDLGRRDGLRGTVDHRARARSGCRLAAHRGGCRAGCLLVAEAAHVDLRKMARELEVGHAALLRNRLGAHRGGRRARRRGRLTAHRGGRRTLVGALQLVTRPSIAGQQRAQDADQSQGQQLPSHGVISGTLC